MKKIYTSDEILTMEDLYQLAEESANLVYPEYKLTEGEKGWFHFVDGRYSIADYIRENSYVNDDDELVLKLDADAMGQALKDDGCFPKAVCLSDDTALQKIFFWCALEPEND